MKKYWGVVFAVGAAAFSASAAARETVISPAYNWSGFYAGVHGGYLRGRDNIDQVSGLRPSGGFGGLQIGYWTPVSRNWLLGFESDVSFSDADATDAFGTSIRLNSFGTARTRLGYAQGQWLLYATGGLAWARASSTNIPTSFGPLNTRQSFTGWAAGLGAEYAFAPNWSARAEYIFADLGRNDEVFFFTPIRQDLSFGTFRVGLNYRPGNAATPAAVFQRGARNWSGPYVGVHGGTARGAQSMDYLGGTVDFAPKGEFFGVQGGYNWQLPSNFVLGIESDLSFANVEGTFLAGCCVTKTDRFGTARLRAGYAFADALIYATMGLGWSTPQNDYFAGVSSSNRPFIGLAWGGGIEYALSARWSVRAEYLRLNFEENVSDYGGLSPYNERGHLDVYRIGVNYRASLFDLIAGR